MSSAIYPLCRQRIMEWLRDGDAPTDATFVVFGVDDSYTYDAADENISDVIPSSVVTSEVELENVVAPLGVLDADDITFTGLDDDDEIHAVIIALQWSTGDLLMSYIDQSTDGSLPQPIDSTQAIVQWNASGIFRI